MAKYGKWRGVNMVKTIEQQLLDALKAARDHLEYCNYGDNWESECAREANLPEQISEAIERAEEEPVTDDERSNGPKRN